MLSAIPTTASSASKHIRQHEPVSLSETYQFLAEHHHQSLAGQDISRHHVPSASVDDGPSLSSELRDSPFFDATSPAVSDMLSTLPPPERHDSSAQPLAENHSSLPTNPAEQTLNQPGQTLEERFEFIQTCLTNAGFASIDELFCQYYTADFSHESQVSSRQRGSRHSELPALLARLRRDIETWTQWEAHGYESEIIKSAASIVRAERADFTAARHRHQAYVEPLSRLGEDVRSAGGGSGTDNTPQVVGAFRLLMKSLQESVRLSLSGLSLSSIAPEAAEG